MDATSFCITPYEIHNRSNVADRRHGGGRLTGIEERTALLQEALRALIAREASRRLARLGGSEPGVKPIPRRRSAKK